jgi:hypothetical protein
MIARLRAEKESAAREEAAAWAALTEEEREAKQLELQQQRKHEAKKDRMLASQLTAYGNSAAKRGRGRGRGNPK